MDTQLKQMKTKNSRVEDGFSTQQKLLNSDVKPYFEGDLDLIQIAISAQNVQFKIDEIELLILNGLRKFLDLSSMTIFQVEDEQDLTFNVKVMTDGPFWSNEYTTRLQPGLLQQCFAMSQPILAVNTPEDFFFNIQADSFPSNLPQLVRGFPLISNEQKIGLLVVTDEKPSKLNVFQEKSLLFLTQVLANAIYHDQLIQQFRIANADLEANRWDLLRSRNTLRALFDSIPSSIYIINKEFDLVAVNSSRADRVNKAPKDLVGKKCFNALFGRDDPCPGCLASETLLHGNNTNRTLRGWILPDRPVDWDIATYPIKNEFNDPYQVIFLEQDVTEKRRMEANLAQSEKLAAVGQLAAGVAHEINNPLSAIIANAQLLARDSSLNEDQVEAVELIEEAGLRASHVVRELLGFARKEQFNFEPTDLNATIQSALSILQYEIMNRSVEIILDLEAEMPLLDGNKDYLQGIWLNLILNAMDALDHSEKIITITSQFDKKEFRVSVADTGVGIPPDRISRIFEPFYTTKDPGRGTGLGLSVIHRTIKQHGGFITVDSQVGKGTVFTVILPYESRQSRNPSDVER